MKKLHRNPEGKWLGGVCRGIADYTGYDVTLIRLLVAVLTVLGVGSVVVAYIVAWILIPVRPAQPTVWAQASDAPTTPHEPPPPSA